MYMYSRGPGGRGSTGILLKSFLRSGTLCVYLYIYVCVYSAYGLGMCTCTCLYFLGLLRLNTMSEVSGFHTDYQLMTIGHRGG